MLTRLILNRSTAAMASAAYASDMFTLSEVTFS